MLVIVGGRLPAEAVEALRAHPEPLFALISSMPSVRLALFNAQNGRCAYCERRIRLTAPGESPKTRIEHYHPQSRLHLTSDCKRASNARTGELARTSWLNLLLCCLGNGADGATCDRKKESTDICSDFTSPKLAARSAQSLVEVTVDGRVAPRPPDPSGVRQAVLDDVLGLNDSELVRARTTVRNARLRYIADRKRIRRGLSVGDRREIAERFRREALTATYGSVLLTIARVLDK